MKQKEFAKWLKYIIIIAALFGMILCIVIAPLLGKDIVNVNKDLSYMFWPCLIFIWITAIPFYTALWKSWLICCEISKDNSFCKQNADQLKIISRLAIAECFLYFAAAVTLTILNLLHPSILLIILFIIFIGISISVVSATLSHLVEKASALKQENDLTI